MTGTRLDLGSGVNKPEGYLGLDILEGSDVICDLTEGIPFPDDSAEEIRAKDLVEHIPDTIPLFNECWRVLRAGGTLRVEVPRWPHVDAIKDPTHVCFFAVETFTEYLAGPDRLEFEYGMKMWDIITLDYNERRIWAILTPRHKGAGAA